MSNGLTRRRFLLDSALTVAGAGTLSTTAQPLVAANERGRSLPWLLDMVHHNPGEPLTKSAFTDPAKLAAYGYGAQVVNEFRPPHTAITFDSLDPDIFPVGSDARAWVEENARRIDDQIDLIHTAGLQAFYFTDIIVLPKRLVELYGGEILDDRGRVNLDRLRTQEIHRIMLGEVFDRFPGLDGLVIRTGETYLQNVPFHTGNNPITRGADSHEILIGILRDEVCERRDKPVFYRTWSFDGFHTEPSYYLDVTDRIDPHPNLAFSIKHTQGDYWRTRPFNPTIGIGEHQQIVEVQCQREYEGKGACPNYVIDGVVNGFEEFRGTDGPIGLADVADNPLVQGVWSWSRGGGWRGPYITNELWCDLNTWVIAQWAQDTGRSEQEIFAAYARRAGLRGDSVTAFRRLASLSAAGTLRGHYSTVFPLGRLTWTRDQFLGGSDDDLASDFDRVIDLDRVEEALVEKAEAARIWAEIARLAVTIPLANHADREYLRVSSRYGLALYSVIHRGWEVMLRGFVGDRTGSYDRAAIRAHLRAYDRAWEDWERLAERPSCATLYQPYSFGPRDENGIPTADPNVGMKPSVDGYRHLAASASLSAAASVLTWPGEVTEVNVAFHNHLRSPATDVEVSLSAPSGWTVEPAQPVRLGSVRGNSDATASWQVRPPGGTAPGTHPMSIAATYRDREGSQRIEALSMAAIPFARPSDAFDNVGISDDDNTDVADLDGAGSSLSAQALAAAGVTPGTAIAHGGVSFTWPDVPAGQADNVVASGEGFELSGSGATLGMLATSTYGQAAGTVTVAYTDGTTEEAAISVPDWFASPPADSDPAITMTYRNRPGNSQQNHEITIYFVGMSVESGKTVRGVALPNVGEEAAQGQTALHVFALAIGP